MKLGGRNHPCGRKSELGMKPGGGNHPCGRKSKLGMKPGGRNHPCGRKKQAGDETERQQRVEHAGLRTGEIDIGQWRVPFGESREGGFSEAAAGSAGVLLRTLEADIGQLRV